jgi:hypothetical protein
MSTAGFNPVDVADSVHEKQEASFVARAALAGFTLENQSDGTWLAGRWGHFRPLADAAAVERFLRAVGAPE